jgi:hypothetical protein
MADVTTQAESSPAEVDVFNGETPTLTEYNQFRSTGEVPERFKPAEPAESAPADAPQETEAAEVETPEIAPESDPETAQEHPQKPVSPAQKRILQLLAEKKELQRKLEAVAKPDAQSGSSPAQTPQAAAPQNYAEYRKQFKPAAWIEEYAKANPESSYEDATAAMADHLADAREHYRTIEQRVQAETKALDATVEEARTRYEDFDAVKETFLGSVLSDKGSPMIPLPVLEAVNDSDVLADVIYTIGSDEKALADFVRMAKSSPIKAIKHVAVLEGLIKEELAKTKGEKTQAVKAPERQRTSAPKPPSPVGGGSSKAFDVSDDSLSPEEWMRQRNRQLSGK